VCFICGFERKIFEKEEKDFDKHRLSEHNLWDYVYYSIYLKSKDPLEYSGLEYYVNEKFKSRNTNWFPILKTKYLSIRYIIRFDSEARRRGRSSLADGRMRD
jgi:hypothetical protein